MYYNIPFLILAASALANEGFVLVGIKGQAGRRHPHPRYGRLATRDNSQTIDAELSNKASFYQISVSMGNSNEQVLFTMDTGSSDTWVLNSQACNGNCPTGRSFDCSGSSSCEKVSPETSFSIAYGDDTSAQGSFVQDYMTIGNNKLKGTFALADKTSSDVPVLGLGLVDGESNVKTQPDGTIYNTYDNIPAQMKQQGLIKANLYSLWLNDIDSSTGSLLFGGVDHAKYHGTLQMVPIVIDGVLDFNAKAPTSLSIIMNKVGVYSQDNQQANILDTATPVLLDSGTTLCYFETSMAQAIGTAAGAQWSSALNMPLMSCSASGGLVFDFSGVEIAVPYKQMLMQLKSGSGSGPPKLPNGDTACGLGIRGWDDPQSILGDTFLRGCYVVYDLENLEIGLAPVNLQPSGSQVDAVDGNVPSAVAAPSYSSSQINKEFQTYSLAYSELKAPFSGSASSSLSSKITSPVSSSMSAPASSSAVSSATSSAISTWAMSSSAVSSSAMSSAPVSSSMHSSSPSSSTSASSLAPSSSSPSSSPSSLSSSPSSSNAATSHSTPRSRSRSGATTSLHSSKKKSAAKSTKGEKKNAATSLRASIPLVLLAVLYTNVF